MAEREFIILSYELDDSGLLWRPEIGDEVCPRGEERSVSIFVDPQGLTPAELRQSFVWLPKLEQIVSKIEEHEGILFHAGVSNTLDYETIVKTAKGMIEVCASSLRVAMGRALQHVLAEESPSSLH